MALPEPLILKRARLTALVKDASKYQWGVVKKPFTLLRLGKPFKVTRGMRIGSRLSSNRKFYRLIVEELGETIVFTLPLEPKNSKGLASVVNWGPSP